MNATATIGTLQATQSAGLPATVPLEQRTNTAVVPGFNSAQGWELAQRIGKAFSQSDLVPQQYRGNLANSIVALEMANRMGASPLMVMQNLYIVHGNPGWSSKFLIACFNQSGKFSALRYEFDRDSSGKATGCRAWAIEKATNEKLIGATITLDMAREEGWSTKSGSKWKTMAEQMLMYRAASFFVRTYAPEISMGLQTTEELHDVVDMFPDGSIGSVTTEALRADRNVRPAEIVQSIDKETGEIKDTPTPAAGKDAPAVSYANVIAGMLKAKTVDALDEAAALISAVADEKQRKELSAKYDVLRVELVAAP